MKDKEENPFVHTVFVPSYNKDGVITEPKFIEGIRLRDKIAIAAMESILIGKYTNNQTSDVISALSEEDKCDTIKIVAIMAYEMADAMLKARNNSSAD